MGGDQLGQIMSVRHVRLLKIQGGIKKTKRKLYQAIISLSFKHFLQTYGAGANKEFFFFLSQEQ